MCRRIALAFAAVAGCGSSGGSPKVAPTATTPVPSSTHDAAPPDSAEPTPADAARPPRILALHKPPTHAELWMTRVCTIGRALVFENDCGCNDALQCSVRDTVPPTIALALQKDPTRMPMCTACFPMVPGRCELPALRAGTWQVTVNGAAAFELVVDGAGRLPADTCWQ